MLRRLLMASVGAIALAGTAVAADLLPPAPPPVYVPPVPIFSWTGVYVGGQIGYAWGTADGNVYDNFGDFVSFYLNTAGVIGGAHVGYNLQLNRFLIGLEGDVDGSSLSRSYQTNIFLDGVFPGFAPAFNAHTSIGVQGSIRGRIGYTWGRALLYATGGVAFAGVNGSISTPFGYDSASTTRVGWTAGGGAEYAVTDNWLIRVEYRYTNFGTSTVFATNSFAFPGVAFVGATANRTLIENRIQAGFSYKFETAAPVPVVAKY